jgi:hypothetical protein
VSSTFYDKFFAHPMTERKRIAEAAGLSLAYIQKHTYVQARQPRFHFHSAVGLDRASNGSLCFVDLTEGEVDWAYVLERLKMLQKQGVIPRSRVKLLPTTQFDAFWAAYPRRVNKDGALKSWHAQGCDKVAPDIQRDIASRMDDWQRDGGKYVPHPTTYINQRRWEETMSIGGGQPGAFAGAL